MSVEIEAKFWVPRLSDLQARVMAGGGRQLSPRRLEHNERFDTSEGRLRLAGQVLRLRWDDPTTLTFKRPRQTPEERDEIELTTREAESARALLAALGFLPFFAYEKYRQVLALDEVRVMLDELPFGSFAEIEGPSLESVRQAASRLGLDWDRRVRRSYAEIFEALRLRTGVAPRDATFDALPKDLLAQPEDLGLAPST